MSDTTTPSALVDDYLRRLDSAAGRLPHDRRTELVDGIREHIEDARRAGADDEAGVRTVLDRLGDPHEIVAAAAEDQPPAPYPPQAPERASIALEIWAVALLTVGSIVFLLGWAIGVVLLWSSRRWSVAQKTLGTLVVPLGPFGALFLGGLLPTRTCSSTSTSTEGGGLLTSSESCSGFSFPTWLGIPLVVLAVVGPFVVGGYLVRRARLHAEAEDRAAGHGPRA